MNSRSSFRVLQPKITTLPRLYAVYVTKEGIYGGYIASRLFPDRMSAEAAFQELSFLAPLFLRRRSKARRKREQFYRLLDPISPSFLNADRRNFAIATRQIASIHLQRGRSWHDPQSVGTLTIELVTGKRWKLFITGKQKVDDVAESVRRCWPNLVVTGDPTPIVVSRRRLPSDAKNDRLITGAMISGIAVITCVYAAIKEQPDRFKTGCLLTIAVVFSVVTWLLIRRWRKNEALKHLTDAIAKCYASANANQHEADDERDQPSESH